MKAIRLLAALFALVLTARAAEVRVVAANPVLADIVRQLAGNSVQVEVLLPENASSREFEPTDEVAGKLRNANLLVVNGAGYEPWLEAIVKQAGYTGPVVDATENVPLYDQSGTLHQPNVEEAAKNLFEVTDLDPFAWHDPRNVVLYAETVARALGDFVPSEKMKEVEANLVAFSADLRAAHAEALAKLGAIPAAKRRLVTPYDSFRYFSMAYSLPVSAIPGLASGTIPRAAVLERLFALITQLRVPAVFFEPTAHQGTLQRIATETGSKTVTTLVAEGLGPVGSPTGTYLGMFRANVDAIATALK